MPDTCIWTQDDYYGAWETDCDHVFMFDTGTPTENDFRFCPYCGKPLVESDKVEDTDATDRIARRKPRGFSLCGEAGL